MAVNAVTPSTATDPTSTSTSVASAMPTASSMQDEFLQLLTTQLKNQDPLAPVDQTQMLSQLAQFSSLEQMQNLNTTMSNSAQFSGLTQSASLIGKDVTTFNPDGSAGPAGQVSSVTMKSGVPYLQIGSDSVAASQVLTVSTSG
jgi:flagellar basal-body rod modification protein FlgD